MDVSNVVLDNSFDFNREANGLQTIYADVSTLQQDNHRISGTIFGESGETIIGANVSIKGNNAIGTITDINGNFTLQVPDDAILIISYIGYISAEIKVGKQQTLSIILREDTQNLEEVVVVGYGVQQKRDITGSIANVKGDNLKDLPVANLSNALQGRAAGIDIVSDGGSPGAEPVIRVRGTGSMSASNPLVVIDGVPSGKYLMSILMILKQLKY